MTASPAGVTEVELLALVERGVIRILDLRLVARGEDGSVAATLFWCAVAAGIAVAGGVGAIDLAAWVPINVSAPLDEGAGWHSIVRNGADTTVSANGWAVCATAS